ncbi:MAG: hypothetical protein AMXMBFR84_51290 [Candidatus Hydrogenedentota bacterium]
MVHLTKFFAEFSIHLFEIESACLAAESSGGSEDCIFLGFNNRRTSLTPEVGDETRIAFKNGLALIDIRKSWSDAIIDKRSDSTHNFFAFLLVGEPNITLADSAFYCSRND